jgi:signal transduction histidine kinase
MRRLLRAIQSHIRYKIILPYLALTLAVTMAGAAISLGLAASSWEDKLKTTLTQMGRDTTEALVQRERDHLAFLLQAAFAQENPAADAPAVPDAIASNDPALVDKALLPFYNYARANPSLSFDRLIAFNTHGEALIDFLRVSDSPTAGPQRLQGTNLSEVTDVKNIVQGRQVDKADKFSNFIIFNPDPQPYFYTVVPVKRNDAVVGGIMVAVKVDRLLELLENSSEATITTFYNLQGQPIGTTLLRREELGTLGIPEQAIEELQNHAQSVFDVQNIRGREFELVYSPLAIANRQVGYFSVGLSRDVEFSWLSTSRNGIIAIAFLLAAGAVLLGYVVARRITLPLAALVSTAEAVTAGDLEQRTFISTRDELGQLAQAFNQMTEHLLRLYRTSRELNALIDVRPVLDVTEQTLRQLAPNATAFAVLHHRDTWTYRVAESAPAPLADLQGSTAPAPDTGLLEDVAQGSLPRVLPPASDARLATVGLADAAMFQSALLTPLLLHNQIVGVLLFVSPEADAFSGGVAPTLLAIANMAASVMCNAMLFSQVREEASERQAILTSIADGVIVCDNERKIVLTNAAAERMLNLPSAPRQKIDFASLPLEPVTMKDDAFGNVRSDLDHYQVGNQVVTFSSAPVIVDGQHQLGEVIVLHDISAEAAVDRAKTQVIATISHELRTPLTVISGYTELLSRGMAGELSSMQSEMLDQVRLRAEQLNNIVKNAVLLANIEAGMMKPLLEPQPLSVAVEQAVTLLRSGFHAKGLTVTVELPDDLPQVLADRDHLHQALVQLLDNARRYTSEGGVTISATQHDSMVQVNISDTGVGIQPDVLDQLFSRFHRVEGNNSPERGGGLGLAITRHLIEQQGGRVWATSNASRGSTFSFFIPVAHAHADTAVTETSTKTA